MSTACITDTRSRTFLPFLRRLGTIPAVDVMVRSLVKDTSAWQVALATLDLIVILNTA